MKKFLSVFLLLSTFVMSVNAQSTKVYINDSELQTDISPIMMNDRTMVPMRAIFEALGADVSWDEQTNTAIGTKNGVQVKATVGSATVYKNEEAVQFDTAPVIVKNRTLVPLRVIAECLGAVVSWDGMNVKIAYAADNDVVVHFLDVGQGDSEFIELPNGNCMLIDASTSDYGSTIADYIKNLGYSQINYLVATHPHADHIGGMTKVFEAFDVKNVYMPNAVSDSKTFERFMEAVEKEGCTVTQAKPGVEIFSDGKLSIEILAPVGDDYNGLNNYSAVVKLTYGDTSYLFTGDAEQESETEILGKYSSDDLKSDVLKVGHHGSSTSSSDSFVRAVAPEYAVISCGKDNSYGHPHQETVTLFNSLGIKMFRTDEDGTVKISSDSQTLSINKETNTEKKAETSSAGDRQSDVYYASSSISGNSNSVVIEQEKTSETSQEIVYKTKTGKKYHKAGCRFLKSSIEITLKDAENQGLEPCNVCF